MLTSVMPRNVRRAVLKYGEALCLESFEHHDKRGEGASTIAQQRAFNGHTGAADAAINAGRWLASLPPVPPAGEVSVAAKKVAA
jgi:hypothetical protein